jgi:bifunctional non-homologous end joining protein LigD
MAEQRVAVTVDGRTLSLSNLDKVLYPEDGFTKGEVIHYYTAIAPALLPHLAGRPLTVVRYPNGVRRTGFFEKNAPLGTPGWVHTRRLPVPGSASGRDTLDFIVVDGLAAVVWLANLAALELHVPQWRVGAAGPDRLVLDLDPGEPAGLEQCAEVALLLRERLAADGLTAYPKTSGRKGMQLMCAIAGEQDAEVVSGYARTLAVELEAAHPARVVSRMAKAARPGRVFIDWSQNNAAKTTVAPYSLRAASAPTVSTPLTWAEVERGKVRPYRAEEVLDRLAGRDDPMAGLFGAGPRVPEPPGRARGPRRNRR